MDVASLSEYRAACKAAHLSLTRRQLAELDGCLSQSEASSGLISVEALHGFLTAIALLPNEAVVDRGKSRVQPEALDDWLAHGDSGLAARLKRYIGRMYDDILAVLGDPDRLYVPLAVAGERRRAPGENWSRGFLRSMALLTEPWCAFLDRIRGHRRLLPIFLLGLDAIPAQWQGLASSAEKRAGLAARIPAIVDALGNELVILELTTVLRTRARVKAMADDLNGFSRSSGPPAR